MHLNHYENPYSRLAQYDELRMRQHGSLPKLYADDLRQYTSLNKKVHASDDKSLKMNQLGNKMQLLDGTE